MNQLLSTRFCNSVIRSFCDAVQRVIAILYESPQLLQVKIKISTFFISDTSNDQTRMSSKLLTNLLKERKIEIAFQFTILFQLGITFTLITYNYLYQCSSNFVYVNI